MNKQLQLFLYITLFIILIIISIQIIIYIRQIIIFFRKYFFISEKNLLQRYGEDTWAVITGGSSGQGRQFCLEFAKRGFNILIIGSKRSFYVEKEIQRAYPHIKTKVIIKNFSQASEKDFFNSIESEISTISNKLSILVNNIGHRTAWNPYHKMPPEKINDTIVCGTIVQARLTRMVLPHMLKRKKRSSIINITAMCLHPTIGIGIGLSNAISIPYLSVYEASNAFGYFHANTIYKEYKDQIDFLNVTPGAVVTENTKYLNNTIFHVDSNKFINRIIKFMGNVNGTTCAHWGHEFSLLLINLIPFFKERELKKVGKKISQEYMKHYNHKKSYY